MAYTLKYNRTGQHIAGIVERTKGTDLDYALSACPALSRSGSRMAQGKSYEDLKEALAAAELSAQVGNRKMCTKCRMAAETALLVEA
jgi:hypothetical protein